MIERHIRHIGGINLHYRESSKQGGVPLVLLHPSPRNSAMFEPLMDLLRNDYHVVAPDTPGYGASDHLPSAPTEISGYVASFHRPTAQPAAAPDVHVVDTLLALAKRYAAKLARFNAVKCLDSKTADFNLPQSSRGR